MFSAMIEFIYELRIVYKRRESFLWCSNVVIYLVVYLRNNLSSKVVT